jgi:hypothetical protein
MNGGNSLPDSDLSLIDVSRGEIQARAWRGKLHLGARQGTKTPLWTRGGHSTTRKGDAECENRRSNAPCLPHAPPLHLANPSATPFAPARYGVPSFFGVLLDVF